MAVNAREFPGCLSETGNIWVRLRSGSQRRGGEFKAQVWKHTTPRIATCVACVCYDSACHLHLSSCFVLPMLDFVSALCCVSDTFITSLFLCVSCHTRSGCHPDPRARACVELLESPRPHENIRAPPRSSPVVVDASWFSSILIDLPPRPPPP